MNLVKLLVFVVCVVTKLSGKELRVRAYYVGSQDVAEWRLFNEDPGETDDPFADEDPVKKVRLLKSVPFTSEFFREGDRLWDVTDSFPVGLDSGKVETSVVYNETTERVVLRGNEVAHSVMGCHARKEVDKMSFMMELDVRLYRVACEGLGVTLWNGESVAQRNDSLATSIMMTKAGPKTWAELKLGKDRLNIEIEPYAVASDDQVNLRLSVGGELQNQSIDVSTEYTGRVGLPATIELGGVEGDEVLLLWVKPEVYFWGEVKKSELVLDEAGPLPGSRERLRNHLQTADLADEIDPATGKAIRHFFFPLRSHDFLEQGGAAAVSEFRNYPVLETWNSRVFAKDYERVVDLRRVFELQGVKFSEDDFACLVDGREALYVSTTPEQMRKLEEIVEASRLSLPRVVACSLVLIEGDEEVTLAGIDKKDSRCLAKAATVVDPGLKSVIVLGEGDRKVEAIFEPNISEHDDLVQFAGKFTVRSRDEVIAEWGDTISLSSGARVKLLSYQKAGKWYALIVNTRILSGGEWLLPE